MPVKSAQPQPISPALLTLPELSVYIGRAVSSIYRDVALGHIPASVRIGGGRQLWRRQEIDAWLEAGCPARDKWEAMKTAAKTNTR
jgi:predicted DNA-binding transcriptional regulator AlpA